MQPNDFLDQLNEEEQAKKLEQDKADQIGAVNQSGDKVVEALKGHTNELTGSIHDLLMATLVSKDPKIAETAKNLAGLLGEIKNATKDIKGANFKPLAASLSQLQETLTTVPMQIEAAHQATDPTPLLKEIATTLGKKNFNPNVSVTAPKVDLSPLTKVLEDIKTAVSAEKETTDNSKLEDLTQDVASAVSDVKDAITSLRFPVANYVLPFSSGGKDSQVTLDSSGNVPVSGSFSPSGTQDVNVTKVGGNAVTTTVPISGSITGTVTANAGTNLNTSALALSATQTDKSQFTKLTDGTDTALVTAAGEQNVIATAQPGTDIGDVTVNNASGGSAVNIQDGGNSITVDGTVAVTGVATATNQTNGSQLAQIVDAGGDAVTVTGGKLDVNATISGSGGGTSEIDNSAFTAGAGSETPIAGFYHSTIDTVTDGRTATLAMDSKRNLFNVIRDAAGNARGLNVDANGAIAATVTNATASNLKVAATLDAETTKVIGTVNQGTSPWVVSGAVTNTVLSVVGTGTEAAAQRVTLASDSTGVLTVKQATASNLNATVVGTGTFVTQATLAAETTKVIGTVNVSAGQTIAVTNAGTFVTQPTIQTGTNSIGKISDITTSVVPGTAATNLGKAEDGVSADGDTGVATLMVRKATPANTSGTDGDYEFGQMSAGRQWVWAQPNVTTISTSITRPGDGNAYAANDALANSTSSPTSGGFTFTGAALASGGSGTITDCVISASAGTAYLGEIWIFDQAVTATNDNAALSVSDSDILNLVGVIPFQTTDVNAANAISYVTGLNIGYTCVGTANLRFLVKIMSAVTPASAEVLSVRIKVNN